MAESDKIIRELRAREDDLNEALRSKDSQIAVLRVRFDELDADLRRRDTDLAAARADAERVLRDHSNSSDLHAQLVDTLKSKCDELEASLAREKEAYTNIQVEQARFCCSKSSLDFPSFVYFKEREYECTNETRVRKANVHRIAELARKEIQRRKE